MVKIRLRRMGARNRPYYRIVVSDSRLTSQSEVLEELGSYDPVTNPPTNTAHVTTASSRRVSRTRRRRVPTAASASARSPADRNRRSGRFSRHLMTTAASRRPTPVSGGAGCRTVCS